MAWRINTDPVVRKCTVKLAKEWSEMPQLRKDRNLNATRIQIYKSMLQKGLFRPVNWAKVYCSETDQTYRVNGQHTSTVFASALPADLERISVIIEDYICDTMSDAADLYATFDSKVQNRTTSDINKQFASVDPQLEKLNTGLLNIIVGAISMSQRPGNDHHGKRTACDRAQDLLDYVPQAMWLSGLLCNRSAHPHITRVSVMGAMINTWSITQRKATDTQRKATDFWVMVRDATATTPDCPTRKLGTYLLTTRANRGLGARAANRNKSDDKEIYSKCIHAWNAWRKGKPTELKYYAEADVPKPE